MAECTDEKLKEAARKKVKLLEPVYVHLDRSFNGHSLLDEICYSIKGRLKSVDRIIEKVSDRRKNKNPDYCVDSMTDIVGFRFVCLFQSEIPEAMKLLQTYISQNAASSEASIYIVSIKEAIFYDSRPDSDKLSIREDVVSTADALAWPISIGNRTHPLGPGVGADGHGLGRGTHFWLIRALMSDSMGA